MQVSRFRYSRRGFTLVELMVVIAMISLLASILFPVFAQARERGRQTVCTSQLREVALSFGMYQQDYDERFPPLYYAGQGGQTKPDNFGLFRWPWLVQPYVKSFDLFFCPSDRNRPDLRDKKDPNFGYDFGLLPSWGYNAHYLSPGEDPFLPDEADFKPIVQASVVASSATVLLAESTWFSPPRHGLPPNQPQVGFYRVYPPSQWAGAPPLDGLSYGHCWPRHLGLVTSAFTDGHVKNLTLPKLNEETLWKAQK